MYYVYIIYSAKLGKEYIGYACDLRNRFKEHNNREVAFTSRGVPWKLVYYEAFLNKAEATGEERFLKTGKGRERRDYLLKETRRVICGEVA